MLVGLRFVAISKARSCRRWPSREDRPPTRCPVSRAAWPCQTHSEALGRVCDPAKGAAMRVCWLLCLPRPVVWAFGCSLSALSIAATTTSGCWPHAWRMPRALRPFPRCKWLALALRPCREPPLGFWRPLRRYRSSARRARFLSILPVVIRRSYIGWNQYFQPTIKGEDL